MTNIKISPSILSADLCRLGEQVQACERAGADNLHIDVMDGNFVPNITFGPGIVKACKSATSLPLDVHLMIHEPERHFEAFAKAGADRITIHHETCPHIHRSLQSLRELGVQAGVSYNPASSLESLPYIAELVDLVLVMSVNPGFGGQSFIPGSLQKISQVQNILTDCKSNAIIQVDGGIAPATIKAAYLAGARDFVAGNAIFTHPDGIERAIKALREASS